ncbi:MAG: M48 family metallopeptidase [Chitinophagaceae bacterium]|nr:M48 family metallopeptidase [Oligoflexus sp.]
MKYVFGSVFALTLLIIACARNSAGRNELNLVSDSEMDTMGDQAYQEILNTAQLSNSAGLNNEIYQIGQNIAVASGANFDWKFTVISEDTVNAFCLPGGKVAVYTGIIPVAANNAALAAVLGHEVGHAVLRHSSERMSQQMLLQAGLSLATLSFSDSPYKGIIAAAMGVGSTYGVQLPFSRLQESEADKVGLMYMAKAGYDPQEAIHLWERMGALSSSRPPEILSDHPDPSNRAKALSALMGEALNLYHAAPVKQPTISL